MKFLFIPVFVIIHCYTYGQGSIQGYVLDKATFEPLSYASIGAVRQQYGCYSDTCGMFTLYFLNETDSVMVSHLGYKSQIFTIKDLGKQTKIYLETDPLQLREVIVLSKKSKKKEMELGFFKRNKIMLLVPSYGNIYTTFIPYPADGSKVIIKSVKFVYSVATNNYPVRIRFIKANGKGEPGEDIVNENIIFNNYKPNRAVISNVANIDVSRYNIPLPQTGVFVAIEWLSERKPLNVIKIEWNSERNSLNRQEAHDGPYINSVKTLTPYSQWVKQGNKPKWERWSNKYTLAIGLTVVNYIE